MPQVRDRLLVANLGSLADTIHPFSSHPPGAPLIAFLFCDEWVSRDRTGRFAILVLDSVTYTNSIVAVNFKRVPASRGDQSAL